MSIIPDLAAADLELARRALMDFVPWSTRTWPKPYTKPLHLKDLVDELQLIATGEVVHLVAAAPPQHAKTETVVRAIAWLLWLNPALTISYSSYSARRSRSISRKVRDLVEQLGVRLRSRLLDEWRTEQGGGMLAAGVRGPLTGYAVDVAFVDDPYKNRKDAESAAYNEALWDWVQDVLLTRGHAKTSYIIFATRWTPRDLSGELLREGGWKWLNLPAVSKSGEPLWRARWSKEQLEARKQKLMRRSAYTWDSLWMGNPRPRGATVFTGEPGTYTELPKVYRAAFGTDLAYSVKTSADSSAVVKLLMDRAGLIYVAHVAVMQVQPRRFKRVCRRLHRKEPGAPWLWYTSTTETGTADLFNEKPFAVPLEARIASQHGDKRTRALPFADAWNAGRVLVPKKAPWLDDFLTNIFDFTGADGGTDDDVDAAVAAYDLLAGDEADADEDVTEPSAMRKPSLYNG